MINSLKLGKDKKRESIIIKDVNFFFRLQKEIHNNAIKDVRNPFRLNKGNEGIKDRRTSNIRKRFEKEKREYYKSVRVSNFWSRIYIEYESIWDKTLAINEYLNQIRQYLKAIVNDLRQSDTWKT